MKPEPGNNPFSSAKTLLVSTHGEEKQTAYMSGVHIPVILQELPDAESDRSDECASAGFSQNELIHSLTQILLECGIPASLTGHMYVRKAILLEYYNANYRGAVYKALYPDVASYFHTTPSRVERAIRHAIEVGWSRGNIEVLEKYFGHSTNANKGKPTNSEFIATISDYLQLRYPAGAVNEDSRNGQNQLHM